MDREKKKKKRFLAGRLARLSRMSRQQALVYLSGGLIVGVLFSILLTTILFAWYAKDLPRPDKIRRITGLSTIIYDRKGEVLYDIYNAENRIPVAFEEMPETLKQATLAIEDKDFYKHQGFDPRGIIRAVINITLGKGLQGGSTLTQQLVKNVLLTSERTLARKVKEFILSVQIEKKYNKDEILQMYLNEAPYGGTAWGIEAAAQTYFNKHAKELNPLESVILAGLPQRPSTYSPFGTDPKAYIERSKQVLRRMREDGYLSGEQEKDLSDQLAGVEFSKVKSDIKAPHFVMYVRNLLIDEFDFTERMLGEGGLRVYTTLDYQIQEKAEMIVAEEVERVKNLHVGNGAAVVLDPKNGDVLAMVGSRDYFAPDYDGKFNVATAFRQPGSAIKPITYVTAFDRGFSPATILFDVQTEFPGGEGQKPYIPGNYDGKFRGPVQARFALGNSINLAAVKMLARVGVKNMLSTAHQMGLINLEPTDANIKRFGLSITLGGGDIRLLDLTSAFAVLATGGLKHDPSSILRIEDSSGKILFERKETASRRVLAAEPVFLVSHILSDNNARNEVFGPKSWLLIPGKTVAVKTGTTDDKRDNWTIGYTNSVVVGAWVGNNDNSSMDEKLASGVTGAAPIWHKIMREILNERSDGIIDRPANIVTLEIDAFLGGLPHPGSPTRSEYFIKGTEPTTISPFYQKLKVSKNSSDKLANEVEIAAGEFEEKEFIVFKVEDPLSFDGKNRWQEGVDKWLKSQADSKYHPPTEVSTTKQNEVRVLIKEPSDKSRIDNNDIRVKAEIVSLAEVVKVEILANDVVRRETSGKSIEEVINLNDGVYVLKVRADDSSGNRGEAEVKIGVNRNWDEKKPEPTNTPMPTNTPTPTP